MQGPNSEHLNNRDNQVAPEIESNEVYSDLVGQKREYDGSMYNFQESERPTDIETEIERDTMGGYGEQGVFADYRRPGKRKSRGNESDEELHLGPQEESMFDRAGFDSDHRVDTGSPIRGLSHAHPDKNPRTFARPAADLSSPGVSRSRHSRQSDHTGKGPRGYRRKDKRIEEEINEHLTAHPDIDASEMEVSVTEGEVTILGMADTRHSKWLAEDIALNQPGVREVHNRIRIRRF